VSLLARARVQVLTDQVADQIAAGEVVERPGSVVKELVENALDAGARAVRVELEDGGKVLIRVSDDGSGMDREDARLALQRHATSKIRTAVDLIGVATFGFRGEALPAIASVSRFELETAEDNGDAATRLRVTGGKLEATEETARQRGTTVTVRGLFYNTPARRKFLRASTTETRAAVEAVTVLALTRPDVAFSVTNDGRVLLDCQPANRLIDRVRALWSAELAHHVLVEHALMRRVLIDNRDALVGLEEDEGLEDLQQRWRQVFGVRCQGVGAEEFERHSGMCGARIRLPLKPNT